MRIYLDNNATTQIHPEVLESVTETLRRVFGNASSIHKEGQSARRVLEESRERVAELLLAPARDIVFTSGGTESNNAAIYGRVSGLGARGSGHHVVTTAIEHPSVLEPVRDLESRGVEVTIVNPDRNGVVPAARIIDAIRPETSLVAMMLVNNETGVIQPVGEVGRVTRERGVHLHCDAVQAPGRIPIDVEALHADTVSIAAHKIHGPKGIGALYVRKGTILNPHLAGGAQERRRRAGTENAPLAAGFAKAAEIAMRFDAVAAIEKRRDDLERRLVGAIPGAKINGGGAPRVANTSSVCFRGHDAEGIVIGLDLEGVAISTGSACSSGRLEPSHVLLAMGLSEEDAKGSVRISLSRFTSDEEVDRATILLTELVPKNRRVATVR